jgi:DNA-binding beta-propeller fold protein YncE
LGTFPVGPGPTGIVFDGGNIWIANTGGNTLSKR